MMKFRREEMPYSDRNDPILLVIGQLKSVNLIPFDATPSSLGTVQQGRLVVQKPLTDIEIEWLKTRSRKILIEIHPIVFFFTPEKITPYESKTIQQDQWHSCNFCRLGRPCKMSPTLPLQQRSDFADPFGVPGTDRLVSYATVQVTNRSKWKVLQKKVRSTPGTEN
ncbi:hypothetical protein AVEN_257887-1 [Araneus ventricosus]|uniref:Uncharacterized protein n=1 Tax=Araneus ventricosus TaxID=182803 RepID=A0A4Y2W024_ARAVE|nr:hypothetical protein AVEN_2653-1 [Araneus ventricosus]GBO22297.1 hypothetical protein AVEN_142434-1 [Araneus ventricosus]GBO30525.1 hypothetical protein AVEN_257887-1 [Araneus ventricosus]